MPRRGGPPVAVKVLVAGDPERQAREAALLGALDHPHLVRLLEVVHQPQRGGAPRVALVLELLAGGSLAALLARRGRLRPGEVVTAIAPVAAALAHAHDNGVVHGDLSPGNIVFTAEGRPVLTDLGVARVLGETAAAEVTPAYVDPTVARGGAPGPASDVFGVAAAAFHALTGVAPWNAATPGRHPRAWPPTGCCPTSPSWRPEAPAELLAVIARGLAADPHDRGSAAAFALDLRHACRPEPVRLPQDGVPDAELGRHRPRAAHRAHPPGAGPAPAAGAGDVRARRPRRALARGDRACGGPAGRRLAAAGSWSRRWPVVAVGWCSAADRPAPTAAGAAPSRRRAGGRAPGAGARPDPAGAPEEWRAVVDELYRAPGRGVRHRVPALLDDVYAAGQPLLAADAALARDAGGRGGGAARLRARRSRR